MADEVKDGSSTVERVDPQLTWTLEQHWEDFKSSVIDVVVDGQTEQAKRTLISLSRTAFFAGGGCVAWAALRLLDWTVTDGHYEEANKEMNDDAN